WQAKIALRLGGWRWLRRGLHRRSPALFILGGCGDSYLGRPRWARFVRLGLRRGASLWLGFLCGWGDDDAARPAPCRRCRLLGWVRRCRKLRDRRLRFSPGFG